MVSLNRLELLKRISRTRKDILIELSKPPYEDQEDWIEILEAHLVNLQKVLEQLIA